MHKLINQRSWAVVLLSISIATVLLAWCVALNSVVRELPFPVRVSATHRYREDASGKPVPLHGDSPWSIIVQINKNDTEQYPENRRQKGFNSIVVNLLESYYTGDLPTNVYGVGPFTTPGDFTTPNEKYFARADWAPKKAEENKDPRAPKPVLPGHRIRRMAARGGGQRQPVLAYVPPTGTDSRTLRLDMTKFGGSSAARWFNPTSGDYTTITGAPLANSGSQDFTTPGDSGTGTNGWALVLESR